METFFAFLANNQIGIIMLLVILAFVVFVIQWLAWIFNWGRFRPPKAGPIGGGTRSRYLSQQVVLGEFIFKIIHDFRNFLALVMVTIFAAILVYAVLKAQSQDEMAKSLQAVMATLGGLIGSIVGYYFGESAVKNLGSVDLGSTSAIQTEPGGTPPTEPIVPVETPETLLMEDTGESNPPS